MNTLTITVTPTVTIIDADTTYFRYDNPSPGALVEYCLTLVGDEPAGHTIAITAEEDFAAELIAASEMVGFAAYAVVRDDDPLTEEAGAPDQEPPPPSAEGTAPEELTGLIRPVEAQAAPSFSRLPVVVLGATVSVVLGAGLWAVGMSSGHSGPAPGTDVAASDTSASSPAPEPVAEPIAPEPEEAAEAAETVVLAQDGLEVTLPAGFHLEAHDDMWKAEGDDPDFRLQLAIDDLYGLPGDQLLQQVEREISMDEELELVAVDDHHIEYRQYAVDGSEATWVTWVEGDMQLSVGCHTRFAPTTVQRATCHMAYESATYTAPTQQL